jgi:hypothetical protein
MEWIRKAYNVPAMRGGRIEYTAVKPPRRGKITGAQGGRLRIRLDGESRSSTYHPTWEIRYLDSKGGDHE